MVNVANGIVEFSFFRPDARAVFLAGDFNHWRPDQVRMTRKSDGYWQARLHLPAGVYKFRYCADGVWYTDYAAFGVEPGQFGMDSVLHVRSEPLKVKAGASTKLAAAGIAAA
jgi:1,4-alpha-glucan branching enzyme